MGVGVGNVVNFVKRGGLEIETIKYFFGTLISQGVDNKDHLFITYF